jgi:predicted RNase H-like HicB family nuclease
MRYTVVYERAPSNYSAYVPHLPVVVVVGDTLEELAAEAREAIGFHLEGLGRVDDSIEIELVGAADYDGDLVTLTGERVPARSVRQATGA